MRAVEPLELKTLLLPFKNLLSCGPSDVRKSATFFVESLELVKANGKRLSSNGYYRVSDCFLCLSQHIFHWTHSTALFSVRPVIFRLQLFSSCTSGGMRRSFCVPTGLFGSAPHLTSRGGTHSVLRFKAKWIRQHLCSFCT